MLYKAEDEAFGKKYIEFGKTGKKDIGVYVLPKILDEQVAFLHLEHVNAKLSTLTPVQAEYLGLEVVGPYKSEMYDPIPITFLCAKSLTRLQLPLLISPPYASTLDDRPRHAKSIDFNMSHDVTNRVNQGLNAQKHLFLQRFIASLKFRIFHLSRRARAST